MARWTAWADALSHDGELWKDAFHKARDVLANAPGNYWIPLEKAREDGLIVTQVMAFTEVALEYELDDPIPDRGVGRRGPTGPYIIYLSEPDADKLLQNVATIFVGQGDNRVSTLSVVWRPRE